ncbi:hypothetical protein YC2023_059585 [Brassica napus]
MVCKDDFLLPFPRPSKKGKENDLRTRDGRDIFPRLRDSQSRRKEKRKRKYLRSGSCRRGAASLATGVLHPIGRGRCRGAATSRSAAPGEGVFGLPLTESTSFFNYVVRGGHEVWASERMYSSCLFSESNSNRSITKPEVSVASCKIKNTELIKRAFFQNVCTSKTNLQNYLTYLHQQNLLINNAVSISLKDLTAANMSVLRGCLVDGAREASAVWQLYGQRLCGRALCGQEWSGCEVCVRAMCGRGLCGCATSSGQTSCEVVRNQG